MTLFVWFIYLKTFENVCRVSLSRISSTSNEVFVSYLFFLKKKTFENVCLVSLGAIEHLFHVLQRADRAPLEVGDVVAPVLALYYAVLFALALRLRGQEVEDLLLYIRIYIYEAFSAYSQLFGFRV